MQFCQLHWDQLREKIDARGLGVLVSETGEEASKKVLAELSEGRTIDNFDPLMGAMWAIVGNVSLFLGGNSWYLLTNGSEDPVEGYPGYEGRTWSHCPICYISLAHEMTCTDNGCSMPKVDGYAWMLDKAADEQLQQWKALQD